MYVVSLRLVNMCTVKTHKVPSPSIAEPIKPRMFKPNHHTQYGTYNRISESQRPCAVQIAGHVDSLNSTQHKKQHPRWAQSTKAPMQLKFSMLKNDIIKQSLPAEMDNKLEIQSLGLKIMLSQTGQY